MIATIMTALPVTLASAAPMNDAMSDPTPITIPHTGFSHDVTQATLEDEEPRSCIPARPPGMVNKLPRTVWFSFTSDEDGAIIGSAMPYTFESDLLLDRVGIGLFRRAGESLELLACSEPDPSPLRALDRLRSSIRAGDDILVQVICQCAHTSTAGLYLTWEIANDARASATSITSLPHTDDAIFLDHATQDPDEPKECRSGPIDSRADPWGTVWYEYTPSADEDLRVTTHKHAGGVDLGIFEQVGDSLVLIECVPGDQQNEDYEHAFDWARYVLHARAGHRYLFQVHTGVPDARWATFSLQRVPNHDLEIRGLRVTPTASVQPAMAVNVTYGAAGAMAFIPSLDLRVSACPVGQPDEACFDVWTEHRAGQCCGWSETTFTLRWGTTGCVGDFELSVVLIPWFDVDPDLTDNTASTIVRLGPDGISVGAGRCGYFIL